MFIGKTDLNGVLDDVKGAKKVALSHVAYKPQLVTVAYLPSFGGTGRARVTMEDADFGLDEIVVKPNPYICVEYYVRGFRYIGDSLRAYGAGIIPVAYDTRKDYKPKTRDVYSIGVFAKKAPGWHLAEISNKAEKMCKRNNGPMTEKWVMREKVKEVYGLSMTKDGDNRWRVENPKGKVGQIVHNGDRSYATLDAARMQRYQDEKQGNNSLMKKREEKDYAYEYADIYRLPGDDDGDIPDLARLVMAMHHWEHNSSKGRERNIYYAYVVTHYYADEAEFKARSKELNQDYLYSNMTLEKLQTYEREHNIPALDAAQLKVIPGLSLRNSRMRRFHDCLDDAIERHRNIDDTEAFATAVLERLADGCRVMGLPQAWCARVAGYIPLLDDNFSSDTIESAFKTAYLRQTLKAIPMKFTRPSALLTYKTEAYMKEHYTLRLNVMTGTPEYRMNAVGYGFQPLDQAARNTMTINALKAGVESWDKDLNRYIDSNLIPHYNPMEDYLNHLPRWNGRHDYVGELAHRVKTDNEHWENDFHTWMLSMVAQWLGKDRQHGNAIVPLLIGPQGSGKTSFCRRLLPEYLQVYYNDRLSMKNDNDIFMAMSSYALINIDEFDAMARSQQPILKYLLSKHDVKFRPPYGKTMEERQRFASFIATTNNRRPLTNPTGSRRFVCVYADEIDNAGLIAHDHLYAQLCEELRQGRHYWFEEEENTRIMKQNEQFRLVSNYEQMIALTYLPPEQTPHDAKPITIQQVMKRLEELFPTFSVTKTADVELGKRLTRMGYERKRNSKGAAFVLQEL